MRKLLVLVLMLAIIAPVAAQVDTPTPDTATLEPSPTITPTPVVVEPPPPNPIPDDEPGELPVTTPETLLGQLFSLLKDATFIAWASAGVVVIVGVIKVVAGAAGVAINGNAAIAVTLVVQVLVWIGYAITNYLGQGEAFRAWYLAIVDVARSLLPLFGSIFAGHMLYQAAAKRDVPILGYSKPEAFKTTGTAA